jgi:excisionase family DNA binding protein
MESARPQRRSKVLRHRRFARRCTHVEPLLLTVTQAAVLTGFGRSTLYAMAAAGELPVVRYGSSVRINAAELKTWISKKTAEGRRGLEAESCDDLAKDIND